MIIEINQTDLEVQFFLIKKALFYIHHVKRLAVNCHHQNKPHYRHQQHKHRGVQAIYRVR